MTREPPLLQRIYDGLALFAILNVAGLVMFLGSLFATGALDTEKARRMVAVLRGAELMPPDTGDAASGGAVAPENSPPSARDPVASEMELEIRRLEADRIKTELDQRLAINNSILLKVTTERERFRKEKETTDREQKLAAEHRGSEGFQKQVAIFESLSPKVAAEHLLNMADPDEAARILLELEPRKAKAVVEQAKTGPQLEKMRIIVQRVREVAPVRLAEMEEGR